MLEPEALIDPEAATPAPPARRRRRAVLAGMTALALVAGGVAIAAGGKPSEPEPLALMAGSGDGAAGRAEATSGAAPALGAADSSLAYPDGGWGLKYEVAGDLPDLGDRAAVWRATSPALGREGVARIASALGLNGSPEPRDGGWFVDGGDWTLNTYRGDGIWSVDLQRGRLAGPEGSPSVRDDSPTGPSLSATEAERRVRELLADMGAPGSAWKFEVIETEIGVGWACAAPVPGSDGSPEELRRLEAEKVGMEQPDTAPAEPDAKPVPADQPATDAPLTSCPPPPPPVHGFALALYPVLDGLRADWPVWHLTLRSDGRVESLSGTWVTFERGDEYRLRGIDAALEELRSPPRPYPGWEDAPESGGDTVDVPTEGVDTPAIPVETFASPDTSVAVDHPALPADGGGSDGWAPAFPPLEDPPDPGPPTVVTITGAESALTLAPVFQDGQVRMHLVPAYRFIGRFADGSAWETLVVALAPDAIAPPPDLPVTDDLRTGGGSTGSGPAVPPVPQGAEPAVADGPDSPR